MSPINNCTKKLRWGSKNFTKYIENLVGTTYYKNVFQQLLVLLPHQSFKHYICIVEQIIDILWALDVTEFLDLPLSNTLKSQKNINEKHSKMLLKVSVWKTPRKWSFIGNKLSAELQEVPKISYNCTCCRYFLAILI